MERSVLIQFLWFKIAVFISGTIKKKKPSSSSLCGKGILVSLQSQSAGSVPGPRLCEFCYCCLFFDLCIF